MSSCTYFLIFSTDERYGVNDSNHSIDGAFCFGAGRLGGASVRGIRHVHRQKSFHGSTGEFFNG
jgi:hypothetical protein